MDSDLKEATIMVMVILHYPALLPTVEALRADKEKSLPFFENELPGLIEKTWGSNEETARGASVYHFEDRASADAWFNSDLQQSFRERNHATIEFFEVAAVAFKRPLKDCA
jgi:heme-degrading monooxygenase HmoA